MAKVGLTHSGFYARFKSKDELVAEAINKKLMVIVPQQPMTSI